MATVVHNLHDGLALGDSPVLRENLLRAQLTASVIVAERRLSIAEILNFTPGSILTFNKSSGAPLELRAGNAVVALGQAVEVGHQLGLKITSVEPAK